MLKAGSAKAEALADEQKAALAEAKREIDELRVGFRVQVRYLPPRRVVDLPLSGLATLPRAAPAAPHRPARS